MSSHHFVKEDQEPALLILDADAIPFEKVQELLEWSPLVIVSQTALEKVQDWGIKIDVLITSHDSDAFTKLSIDQAPIQILNLISIQNEFESACKFLMDRKQTNLNIVVSPAQNYFKVAASFLSTVNIVLFDNKGRWHFVGNGSYSKWLPAETVMHTFIDGILEKSIVKESGVFKIERSVAFWVGEEY